MNLQLIKKNIYQQQKRCNMFAPTKRDIVRIVYQEARHFITKQKVPLSIKIYGYGIFVATIFGGCYGFTKAFDNEKNGNELRDATIDGALVGFFVWITIPIHATKSTYHYVKSSME